MIPLGMTLVAGAIGSFFLFALLGFGALIVTAMLDPKIGKERALFGYALALLALTFFLLRPTPPESSNVRLKKVTDLPSAAGEVKADPFAHPDYRLDLERNAFQKFSDTRALPPIELEAPPWIALSFPLAPTIPGPAPGHRRALRGEPPTLSAGDGSAIAEIPAAVFAEYTPVPEDVYDWLLQGNQKWFIYIRALKDGSGPWIREGAPGFDALKWRLARQAEGWKDLQVEMATIGPAKQANDKLAREDVLKHRQLNVSQLRAEDHDQWFLRRTVDNHYREALALYGIGDPAQAGENALRQAARKMKAVGETGKENKEGWRRAATLLELALAWAKENGAAATQRAEILLELLEAYRAVRNDKMVLRTLAEYARTAPSNHRPWAWLGDSMIEIGIPELGLRYYEDALDRNRSHAMSILGKGLAQAWSGEHEDALRTWRGAQATPAARVRIAEGYLRLGRLDEAKQEIERFLAGEPGHALATLIRGAAHYALGDLDTARGAFEAVATMEGATAERAMACYNLGLTCVRLGQHDAAQAAFAAAQTALELGSDPGPIPDETVAPSLGLALVSLATGEIDTARERIEAARREAPHNAYVEFLAGVLAERGGNTASAVRALEESKRLAPEYAELDGWLAVTYLRLGEQQLATGAGMEAAAEYFERAEAFAQRAARREARADKRAYRMQLRLALVQLRSQHLPRKKRYELGLASARKVVDEPANRDQPMAHAIMGYCHYGLGGTDNVKQCMRDFQKVLEDVPEEEGHALAGWRSYADEALAAVKRWNSLEEKTVTFEGTEMPKDWKADESHGVRVRLVDGMLRFDGEAKKDGSFRDPIVTMTNQTLFDRDSIEEVSFDIRCPPKRAGTTANNVVFGVQLLAGRGRGGKMPGIGFFYDKGKMAFRVGGGQKKAFQDGDLLRQGDDIEEREWPTDEWLTVRIAREDRDKGEVAIYISDRSGVEEEVFRDTVSGFRSSSGKALLWFGGWSNEAEAFDVTVRDIRVVRRTR